MKSADLIDHIKFLPWEQLDGCRVTRPFLSLRRVWLARLSKVLDTDNQGVKHNQKKALIVASTGDTSEYPQEATHKKLSTAPTFYSP